MYSELALGKKVNSFEMVFRTRTVYNQINQHWPKYSRVLMDVLQTSYLQSLRGNFALNYLLSFLQQIQSSNTVCVSHWLFKTRKLVRFVFVFVHTLTLTGQERRLLQRQMLTLTLM